MLPYAEALDYIRDAEIDLAYQDKVDGHPLVMGPTTSFRQDVRWAKADTSRLEVITKQVYGLVFSHKGFVCVGTPDSSIYRPECGCFARYSMYGALGSGLGGYAATCRSDLVLGEEGDACHLKNAKLYPGGWVHHLKAHGFPPVLLPEGYKERQLSQLKGKVEAMVNDLTTIESPKMGGFRVEVRLCPLANTWLRVKQQVEATVRELAHHTVAVEVDRNQILNRATEALEAVEECVRNMLCMVHLHTACTWKH